VSEQTAVVIRGCIDLGVAVPDDVRLLSRTCHLNYTRRYGVGELVLLPAADFLRLQKLGVVKAM
jgi:hypothetical protein